jgi:hypothetical protein
LEKLRQCSSLSDLARLIGYKPKSLGYYIHKVDDDTKYSEFAIPKKSGGTRIINAPDSKLSAIQVRLSNLLYDCIDEINKTRGIEDVLSHGFRRKRSIFSNAAVHTNKRYVFNVDIKDFFPTINFGRVRGFLIKNRNFELKEPVATAISQICCYKAVLPQGAPTSPVISNLIGHILDIRLANMALRFGCDYSRYADDITFSSNKRVFPKEIARKQICHPHGWVAGRFLKRKIESSGFQLNPLKTRMQYFSSRQTVTGLTVNKKVRVSRDYCKVSRAMCDSLFKKGVAHHKFTEIADDGTKTEKIENLNLSSVFGRMDHIFQGFFPGKSNPTFPEFASAKGFLGDYKRLVIYDYCLANSCPTLICEGKTDIVYLQSALKKLHKKYPKLIEKKGSEFIFKIRFVRHGKRRARAIGIFDGADNMTYFVNNYANWRKSFKVIPSDNPIVLITDNDSGVMGAKKLFATVGSLTKKPCDGMDPKYEVLEKLWLIPVPKTVANSEKCIEELFSQATLATKWKGMSFNHKTTPVKGKEYGKADFADHVIKPNFKNIDFKNFVPLLDAINSVCP